MLLRKLTSVQPSEEGLKTVKYLYEVFPRYTLEVEMTKGKATMFVYLTKETVPKCFVKAQQHGCQ